MKICFLDGTAGGDHGTANETMEPCGASIPFRKLSFKNQQLKNRITTWEILSKCRQNGETNHNKSVCFPLETYHVHWPFCPTSPNGNVRKAHETVTKKRRRQTIFSWEEDSAPQNSLMPRLGRISWGETLEGGN